MTFGDRLAQLRVSKGLTQEDLGRGLGTDGADAGKSVVYGWEKNQHFPRANQLILICDKLGCSADYLLLGASPEWPFAVSFARFAALGDREKGIVEGRLVAAIEECEDRQPKHASQIGVAVDNQSPKRARKKA